MNFYNPIGGLNDSTVGSSLHDLFVEEDVFYGEEEEDNYEDKDEYYMKGNYAGGSYDNLGGVWAGAITAVADTAGKFAGTGKGAKAAAQKLSEEETRRIQLSNEGKIKLSRQKQQDSEKNSKANLKKWLLIGSALLFVGIIVAVIYNVNKK